MPKLRLVFLDEKGEEKRVEVDRTPFVIGRHSECNLTILDGRLSREHLRIDWQENKFVVCDLGSSNGTTLNDEKLSNPVGLKNEDKLNLGGIEITVEAEGFEGADPGKPPAAEPPQPAAADPAPADAGVTAAATVSAPSTSVSGGGGIPTAFFILAPLLGIFVIGGVILAVVLFGGDKKEIASNNDDYNYSTSDNNDTPPPGNDEDDDGPKPVKSATPFSSGTPSADGTSTPSTPSPGGTDIPPAGNASDSEKVERNGSAFLRQAALKDEKAFLTGEQALAVSAAVKRVKSPALADNIKSARKHAPAIKSLAVSKGLTPQFLAVAAITKLDGGRSDVLQAAQSIAEVYDKLAIPVGTELADDVLLMVAAYEQGVAGDFLKLRDLIKKLAEKDEKTASREIRSIWYLKKSGNLAPADYERALNFLAIGTIAQNPKEFGVNAEALRL